MRCDSHIHIVGPLELYPQLENRTYTAGLATLEQLERAAAPRNVRRFVIVQPSFTDPTTACFWTVLPRCRSAAAAWRWSSRVRSRFAS